MEMHYIHVNLSFSPYHGRLRSVHGWTRYERIPVQLQEKDVAYGRGVQYSHSKSTQYHQAYEGETGPSQILDVIHAILACR